MSTYTTAPCCRVGEDTVMDAFLEVSSLKIKVSPIKDTTCTCNESPKLKPICNLCIVNRGGKQQQQEEEEEEESQSSSSAAAASTSPAEEGGGGGRPRRSARR